MRFWPFVLFVLLLGTLAPVSAQETAPVRRLEGTLTQSSLGAEAKAKLYFEGPASLKVEVERNDAALVPAQVIVAVGNETRFYEPATRRLRRLPYNLAREWYRGWSIQQGGPANFAFTNTPPEKPATKWRRDDVLFGGGGDRAYYAAFKSQAPLWPSVELTATTRREKNEFGEVLAETQVESNPEKLPLKATTVSGGITHTFTYNLKARADAFPAGTFELPAEAKEAVVEEGELLAADAYNGTEGHAHWNKGAALAAGSEDYAAAVTEWTRAGELLPRASAPHISTFELALGTRNLPLANQALNKLNQLLTDKVETSVRQARLDIARRSYKSALNALDIAKTAAPNNPSIALLRAETLRLNGDTITAQDVVLEVLRSSAPLNTQIAAAQAMAALGSADHIGKIPIETEPQKLARTLLQIREGQPVETTDFKNDDALMVYATALERAGQDAVAITAWTTLEGRGSIQAQNEARAHLMALYARKGDTTASLRAFKDWAATLNLETDRRGARLALFDAWQKTFRNQALYTALQNRSQAGGATSQDMRLWLGWQEAYGNTQDIKSIVESGVIRFPSDPFWHSKLAEVRAIEADAQPGTPQGLSSREKLYQDSLAAVDKAASLAPKEPFYAMQRVLVALQRATPKTGVIDAGRNVANATRARQVFDDAEKAWPGDPDVALTTSLAHLGLGGDAAIKAAIPRATAALNSEPGDGDRHTLILAARQALATAARKQSNPLGFRRQYQTLLLATPDVGEQGGLAQSLLKEMTGPNDAGEAVALLIALARQPWSYSEARLLLDGVSERIAATPELAWPTLATIQINQDPAARIAEVSLVETLLDKSQTALSQPEAPARVDADFDRATKAREQALNKLPAVAMSPDTLLAGRAAALLAENTEGENAIKWLRMAVASEPSDPALRLTLLDTLLATGTQEEAKKERDVALRVLNLNPDTRRRLALFSLRLEDTALAWKLVQEAYNDAVLSPDIDANTFQRIAFATARIAFVNKQTARGLEIYNGLAGPQWNTVDRATALLALRYEYQVQGRNDEAARLNPRFAELQLSEQDYQAAQQFLESMAS